MKNSAIQWTDHTFNPWEGCTKVAPECKNCYGEVLVDKRFGRAKWGRGQPRRRTSKSTWKQPLRWNGSLICSECGQPGTRGIFIEGDNCPVCGLGSVMRRPRVFCLSLGDWLDEEVLIAWLADLLDVVYTTWCLDWLLLTKRPQNFRDRVAQCINSTPYLKRVWIEKWLEGEPPPNVWIGVSAGADQGAALDIPARVHFLSYEPMLHGLDVNYPEPFKTVQRFDWIIFGGESGKNARPLDVDWIRQGLAFCRANHIAPFVKQLGAKPYWVNPDARSEFDVGGGMIELRDSHGGDMSEWPEDLRIRKFPIP